MTSPTRHFDGSIKPTYLHLVTPKTTIAKQNAASETADFLTVEDSLQLAAGSFNITIGDVPYAHIARVVEEGQWPGLRFET